MDLFKAMFAYEKLSVLLDFFLVGKPSQQVISKNFILFSCFVSLWIGCAFFRTFFFLFVLESKLLGHNKEKNICFLQFFGHVGQ